MSNPNPVLFAIHIRRLLKIKERPSQYPSYKSTIDNKKCLRIRKLDKIRSEIKLNRRSISSVKKSFEKEKPVNYWDDKYIYDREVESFQKIMLKSLISRNKKLNQKLHTLK